MGPGGATGINFLAVDRAMDYHKIDEEERIDFYSAVRTIASNVLSMQYKEREAEAASKRKK